MHVHCKCRTVPSIDILIYMYERNGGILLICGFCTLEVASLYLLHTVALPDIFYSVCNTNQKGHRVRDRNRLEYR